MDEYTPISEINRLCEAIQEIEGTPIYNELKEIQGMWFSSLKNYWKTKRIFIVIVNVILWKMSPSYYVEETGQLGEVPSNLQNYIDYQALGRDMEIEGNYLITSHGVFEYSN